MATRQHIKTLVSLSRRDFFGIQDITSKDIAAAYNNLASLDHKAREKKYDALLKSRHRLSSENCEQPVGVGAIRYDSENVVKMHGQFEEDNKKELYDTVEVKQMFVPDQGEDSRTEADQDGFITLSEEKPATEIGNSPYRISEVAAVKEMHEVLDLFRSPNDMAISTLRYKNKPPLTFHFVDAPREREHAQEPSTKPPPNKEAQRPQPEEEPQKDKPRQPQREYDDLAGPEGLQVPLHELDPMSEEYMARQYEETKSERFDRKLDLEVAAEAQASSKPMKAIDYLKKVQAKEVEPVSKVLKKQYEINKHPYALKPEIKLDSKGYNIYTYQVPDWNAIRRVDAVSYIKSCIVYNNYDLLVVNKPYGIPSHSTRGDPDPFDMNDLVAEVARSLRIDKVFLTHRLDKATTGLLVFATSEEKAQQINRLFRSNEIKKTYWCLVRGIPDPPEGVIDIPIGQFLATGKLRSVPVPENLGEDKQLAKRYQEARRAVTEYKVLNQNKHMALLECRPQSGVKHQIRCHLGFGLNTPILGDHKYSHIYKLAPQKLPEKVLKAFRLRQSKVRTLPMHLHAKKVMIPNAKANEQALHIEAELPQYFRDNMKLLRLHKESSSD